MQTVQSHPTQVETSLITALSDRRLGKRCLPVRSTPFTRQFLEENLFFGPEVALSSPALSNWESMHVDRKQATFELQGQNCQAALTSFLKNRMGGANQEVAGEFVRALFTVVKPVSGTVFYNPRPREAFNHRLPKSSRWCNRVHTNNSPLSAMVKRASGEFISLNLEPGCVELNQTPGLLRQMQAKWQKTIEDAAEQGFVGCPGLASGGGGGHIHFSFGPLQLTPLLEKPDLLARFLLIPELLPGVLYAISEMGDRGDDATARRLIDNLGSSASKRDLRIEVQTQANFLTELITSRVCLTEHDRHKIPWHLKQHDTAINLKNFPYSSEVRMCRAFGDFESLKAGCEFIFYSLLNCGDISFDHAQPVSSRIHDVPEPILRRQFRTFCRDVRLPPATRRSFSTIGAESVFSIARDEVSGPLIAQTYTVPWAPGKSPSYDVVIPRQQFKFPGIESVNFLAVPLDTTDFKVWKGYGAEAVAMRMEVYAGTGREVALFATSRRKGKKSEVCFCGLLNAEPLENGWHKFSCLSEEDLIKAGRHSIFCEIAEILRVSEGGDTRGDSRAVCEYLNKIGATSPLTPLTTHQHWESQHTFHAGFSAEGPLSGTIRGLAFKGRAYQMYEDCWVTIEAVDQSEKGQKAWKRATEKPDSILKFRHAESGKLLYNGRFNQ